ncbi:unnamed protein product [Pleuronectes platessa]|uniref:Uncharacterized protein n=1 Tax=Pleuronectes platessa TaxID=8262 RepID=A0A9N7UMB2_PLEPL|nr:unnamed protein product [Pleuronectes platessa]
MSTGRMPNLSVQKISMKIITGYCFLDLTSPATHTTWEEMSQRPVLSPQARRPHSRKLTQYHVKSEVGGMGGMQQYGHRERSEASCPVELGPGGQIVSVSF